MLSGVRVIVFDHPNISSNFHSPHVNFAVSPTQGDWKLFALPNQIPKPNISIESLGHFMKICQKKTS